MSQIKQGVLLSYTSLALNNIVAIVYTPFLLRMLGQSEYGLYSLIASIVAYLTVLDLGLGNTIVRYTALYKVQNQMEKLYSLFGLFIKVYCTISLLVITIGIALYCNLDFFLDYSINTDDSSQAKIMLILLIVNLSISFPLSIFGSIITAYQKFIFSRLVNIIRIILQPLIMIPLLFMGYKAITLIIVISILNILTLLANTFYAFHILKIKISFKKNDYKLLKEIAIFAFFVFIGVVMDRMNWSTGQIILGIYSGTNNVAIYAVAMQIILCYFGFASSMSGLFLPRITEIITHKNYAKELTDLFVKIGRIQYYILFLVFSGFFLFGFEFIKYWAGKDYSDVYLISLIIMLPMTYTSIQHTGVLILQALNKQKFRSINLCLFSIINIIISCIFCKEYGPIGCAISFASCITIGNIFIMNYYYYKKINIDIPHFWLEMIKTLPFVLLMFLIGYVINKVNPIFSVWDLIVNILLYTISYLIFCYLFMLTKNERFKIRSYFNFRKKYISN